MGATHFFLGANSGEGFYSLYDQLLDAALDDLMILKGGPGCGKSTLMRRVGEAAEQAGEDVVYIHCSGDPDSLDGAIIPARRTALVDGTAPHVLEPRCTVAHERYLDLSAAYDVAALKAERGALAAVTKRYKGYYEEAYHLLRALDGVRGERRAIAGRSFDAEKCARRVNGIAARELRGRGEREGSVAYAFLGGLTHKGRLLREDSVRALCPRIYELEDSYGFGEPALRAVLRAAMHAGERVLACPDPDRPRELRHLLIPGRGLAFVTAEEGHSGVYRRLRLDALASPTHEERGRLRLLGRIAQAMEAEAVEALGAAKRAHDELEALYHPFVDFAVVDTIAEREIARLFGE